MLPPAVLLNLLLALVTFTPALAGPAGPGHKHKKSPSVIVIIPDGFGPALATLTREFKNAKEHRASGAQGPAPQWGELAIDRDHVGSVQSRSYSSLVTDSAAAGTAFACGVSTNNTFIGFDNNNVPCANVLEGAKSLGYLTGLVSTSRITHATPAAYSSHVYNRNNEALIAEQQLGGYVLGPQVDLLWGGGRRFFIPQSQEGSGRTDDKDLVKQARESGWNVILDREGFDAYAQGVERVKRNRYARGNGGKGKHGNSNGGHGKWHLPSVGLFTSSHLSYEIDRDPAVEPSLKELSVAALQALESNETPFFLMIEAARIDHAAHANDGAATAHDSLAYDEAYEAVTDWVTAQAKPDEYVVLSVADHDTGGASLPSGWNPARLLNATASTEALAAWARPRVANQSLEFVAELVNAEILPKLGVPSLNGTNLDKVARAIHDSTAAAGAGRAAITLAEAQNNYTGIEWGTTGHSQVDVNLFLHPREHHKEGVLRDFVGSHENVWVGQWVARYLGMDLAPIQKRLEAEQGLGGKVPVGSGGSD